MSASENQNLPPWTYRMEVSPTGQGTSPIPPGLNDPIALLHLLGNLQSQSIELQRQILETQRQQLELIRESTQVSRDQRARQIADLERWQNSHDWVLDSCKQTLGKLEQVHSSLMGELADHVKEHYDNLLEGDFSLSDFVDRFGPRLAHLNTMLAVLRPLAAAAQNQQNQNQKKPQEG
ncbi:hypothetical protein BH23PLA1_BH23PLA1_33110 [soil metagenome]